MATKARTAQAWRPDDAAIQAIVAGTHGDPFAVLGMHQHAEGALSVRVFWPGAAARDGVAAAGGLP